jgi:hypothetical protein
MQPAPHDPTRRDFALAAALLAAAPLAAAEAADKPVKLADALAELVRSRLADTLPAPQQALLVQSLLRSHGRGGALLGMSLTNADEPAVVFHADPER